MILKVTIARPDIDTQVAAVLSGKVTHLTDWEVIKAVAFHCEEIGIPIEFVRLEAEERVVRMTATDILDADECDIDLRG